MMHVQSDSRQDQAHFHDRRLSTTSGAGEPVIHLITVISTCYPSVICAGDGNVRGVNQTASPTVVYAN